MAQMMKGMGIDMDMNVDDNDIAGILKEAGVSGMPQKGQNEDDIMAELGLGPRKKPVAQQRQPLGGAARAGAGGKVSTGSALNTALDDELSDAALMAELDQMEDPLVKAKRLQKEIDELMSQCKTLV